VEKQQSTHTLSPLSWVKDKFHYADFSVTSPRQTRDKCAKLFTARRKTLLL